jgi:hypothetical protein
MTSEDSFLIIITRIKNCLSKIIHAAMEIRVWKALMRQVKSKHFSHGSVERLQQSYRIQSIERQLGYKIIKMERTRAQLALLLARLD